KRNARRIFAVTTFGLFTDGMGRFDEAVKAGVIDKVVTTNLTYQHPDLLARDYYISCDMSKYIAYLIDALNHDCSISTLLDPYDRIQNLVRKYSSGDQD
ncbi:MAG: ribose-phosphate pyrophosphokinase, partial [Lachnospiraceae bacterium]|nr:ribose-phosphate pyrophosphokinase [Lachnospiraceae bacterium]